MRLRIASYLLGILGLFLISLRIEYFYQERAAFKKWEADQDVAFKKWEADQKVDPNEWKAERDALSKNSRENTNCRLPRKLSLDISEGMVAIFCNNWILPSRLTWLILDSLMRLSSRVNVTL